MNAVTSAAPRKKKTISKSSTPVGPRGIEEVLDSIGPMDAKVHDDSAHNCPPGTWEPRQRLHALHSVGCPAKEQCVKSRRRPLGTLRGGRSSQRRAARHAAVKLSS